MTKTTRTKVSKSSKGIKDLLACFPQWKGRKVTVIEAGPEWVHVQYIDDQTNAVLVDLSDGHANFQQGPRYGGPSVVHRAVDDHALVMLSRFMGEDMGVEIAIPAGAIGADVLTVAVDALLAGDRRAVAGVLAECGVYAGIATAIVEARAKEIGKREAVHQAA